MKPGILNGNEIEVDCGTDRCISYFMEPLMLIAPFCKYPLNLRLKGITNAPNELSVDALNTIWLPLFSRFVLADTDPSIKVKRHILNYLIFVLI
jgi:RNA 3'-terminal phosphate cyclase-like protein